MNSLMGYDLATRNSQLANREIGVPGLQLIRFAPIMPFYLAAIPGAAILTDELYCPWQWLDFQT